METYSCSNLKPCDVIAGCFINDNDFVVFTGVDMNNNKYYREFGVVEAIGNYIIRINTNINDSYTNQLLFSNNGESITYIKKMTDVDKMMYTLQCEA